MSAVKGGRHIGRHERIRRVLIEVVLLWAFAVTVLRGVRWPSDWAEVHWLLGYHVGLIKRGLVGCCLL